MSNADEPREPQPVPFLATRSDGAGAVVVALQGELDVAVAPGLETLLGEIRREGHSRVIVDLSELTFVDSAGVSVLIKAKKEAEAAGAEFVMRRPPAQVHEVFALVGMTDWLVFEEG